MIDIDVVYHEAERLATERGHTFDQNDLDVIVDNAAAKPASTTLEAFQRLDFLIMRSSEKKLKDILIERNTNISIGEYKLWFNDSTSLWTISQNKRYARRVKTLFETESESQAVEQFLALTARN